MREDGKWQLTELYNGMDDPHLAEDLKRVEDGIAKVIALVDEGNADLLHDVIAAMEDISELAMRVGTYPELLLAANAKEETALAWQAKIMKMYMALEQAGSRVTAWGGAIEDLDARIAADPFLQARAYAVRKMREDVSHLIDPALEETVLRMSMSGAQAWEQLRGQLDAGHMVPITLDGEEKRLPLSAVRGLAYSPDAAVRKTAYEAELKAYPAMETPMAACLNGIKGESIIKAELRHFDSPLDAALYSAGMDRETLDALLTAMRESLPEFRRYFRLKAKALGHENGLPFWELFAPMGGSDRTYTAEEARALLLQELGSFSPKMYAFIDSMFAKEHIDLYPRENKGGGAFCAGVHAVGESYILTNFTGSLSDVSTLAHELGHGYHNSCMNDLPGLAASYPMPLAETASIFNETLFANAIRKKCTGNEKLAIIEQELADAAQVIVDILSRFLFEKEVFARREEQTMTPAELCAIMLDAQKQTYGDGLDPDAMHPYMWACKSHYYSAGLDFYNFPYAFGLLFGKGVFAIYQEKGEEFLPLYDELLRRTGSAPVREVAASVGINVADLDFWRASLRVVLSGIDEMEALLNL